MKVRIPTEKQREFVDLVLGGMAPYKAYNKAYQKEYSRQVAASAAYRVMKSKVVKRYMQNIEDNAAKEAAKKIVWSKEMATNTLLSIYAKAKTDSTKIKAIAELNKLYGLYAPLKVAETDKDGNDRYDPEEARRRVVEKIKSMTNETKH